MIIEIDDPADPRLDDYCLLNDQAARRNREGDEFFIAEGYVSIDRVVDSGHELRSVLVTPSRVERITERVPGLADGDTPLYVMTRDLMASAVGFDLHRGVVASAQRRPVASIDDVAASNWNTVAVLEGLNDAENVGVIARAARALGIDALVLDPTCTDPYSRRTVRVSMGEVLHMPVARATTWPDDLERLHAAGFTTWAMTPAADSVDLWEAAASRPPDGRLAIVVGAEGPGLTDATMRATTHRVRIPIHPEVDSLNVGHAAAITFAAIARPR
ncbi:TrmH family RNA methyltransferase [Ilumatobacter coccineus]|uniref:Putative RNA methyltransferase n=1 Tax=Ilumatobacter coccineus (strain NBRC 103263 / KCTC 29153 / YM16-304) TaxID=1313172 RepID=A0A6C7E017_ILUCY|nr:RNA methyltransferase [Ilumatobacter coccineus]BAN00430.1 putative RNA methyltransferase [Ilumatobacter coccineus YM16-304]